MPRSQCPVATECLRWALDTGQDHTVDPAVHRVGPPGLRLHELRHTATMLAIAARADGTVVQLMLGHKTATLALALYGHLFPDRLADLAGRFVDAVCVPGVPPEPTPEDEEDDR